MRKILGALALVMIPAALYAAAPSALDYAYPLPPANLPAPDNVVKKAAEGTKTGLMLTQVQIDNRFGPPDWFPDEHAKMPDIVSKGRMPHIPACMLCHLPNGNGHPESASVSGLSANYIVEQMHAFRDDNRVGPRTAAMVEMAKDITEDELKQAAAYFAAIQPKDQVWMKVIEAKTAPKNHVGPGGMSFRDKEGGTVPIAANRVYELPQNEEGAENRDQHFGFIDYVPVGAIKKGEALATTGGNGKTIQCSICHGPDLKGLGDVPRLAGRTSFYLIRQLNDIKTGARKGTSVALMLPVVAKLTDTDIVNLAAYAASKAP